jgi:hypothetical protein
METAVEKCVSCYGEGEVVTDYGPVTCPDCFGEGRQMGSVERTEWRLRDIERNHSDGTHGCEADIRWLIHELRQSREALVHILARCQDETAGPPELAAAVQFAANRALGLYAVGVHPAVPPTGTGPGSAARGSG